MEFQSIEEGASAPGRTKGRFLSFRAFPGSVRSSREIGSKSQLRRERRKMDDPEETSSFLDSENAEVKSMERNDTTESGKDTRTEVVNDNGTLESCSERFIEIQRDEDAVNQSAGAPSTLEEESKVSVSALRSMSGPRMEKFKRVLDDQVVNLDTLRELAWSGIPPALRPLCWRLLLGYVPPNKVLREQVLSRKRQEYKNLIPDYYDRPAALSSFSQQHGASSHTTEEENALRQVAVDVPRTAPGVPFFHQSRVQKILERILFIWGIRHPASGYVQGINDLATPFLAIFTAERMGDDVDMSAWNVSTLNDDDVLEIEADSYWCLCKLLDGIQDHYTYAQPGIQKTLFHVGELVSRVENPIASHLASENVEYMQFAFRWVNCLLLREVPFSLGVRLWDTYLSEGPALKEFLVYILSSFLLSWAPELKDMDFQELIMFLQRVPTQHWTETEIELVLSRAFMWRASFKGASSHFY